MQFHIEIMPASVQEMFGHLSEITSLQQFYLSGGTALALQLGHRESEDLDFFAEDNFDPQIIAHDLLTIGPLQDVTIDSGTLNTYINTVKLQFLYYPYALLEESTLLQNIKISSLIDIACTKLITISARGSKKDFIDLFVILKNYSLTELFKKLEEKYEQIDYNHAHILKSLVYFADADSQPMPKMHIPLNWEEVKKTITKKVKEFTF